jgi:hypothetical protein
MAVGALLGTPGTAHALPIYEAGINEGGVYAGSCMEVGGTNTIDARRGDAILQNAQDLTAVGMTG